MTLRTSLEKECYERQMEEELDAAHSYKKRKKVKNRKIQNVDEKILQCLDPHKTKMFVDFNNRKFRSIKSFAVKKRETK